MKENNLYWELKEEIEKAQSIIVFSHVNPDGDTLGSNLALSLMIERYFNKKPDFVYAGCLPQVYTFLPSYGRFKNINEIDKTKIYDLAIAVDVAAKDRILDGAILFDNAKKKVNIDHHKTNIAYGDINIIDAGAACAGTVLFNIFKNWEFPIPKDVAECLYIALLTDTGGFKYENTKPETFMMAAELVRLGVSPTEEFRACYETKPQNMIQFQAYILSKSEFLCGGKVAITKVSQKDMLQFNAKDDYTEGIVEVLRSSKDVEIAAILKETSDGYTKVSLRSKNISVIPVVLDFDGGGHNFAAGCTIKKPVSIAYDKLLECIKRELKCGNI